jgi:hypothetical protein
MLVDMNKLRSKDLRDLLYTTDPICVFKLGAIMSPRESLMWGEALRKVTSIRHRNTLLRVAHGDIYTRAKQHRFGLNNSADCFNCNGYEDLPHKIFECEYVKKIWNLVIPLTNTLKPVNHLEIASIENRILGATGCCDPLILTIHAEILLRIIMMKENQPYLLRPKNFVKLALNAIIRPEPSNETKEKLRDLIDQLG